MYNSPIKVETSDYISSISEKIDKRMCKEITTTLKVNYDITIDPKELIKLLNNDRDSYQKGWAAGYKAGMKQAAEDYKNILIKTLKNAKLDPDNPVPYSSPNNIN